VISRRAVEVAAEAVDVAISRQTVEAAAAAAVAVVVSHPEAVGQCPFVVDRQEVVVAVSSREEVRRQWLPAFICMSPFRSRNNVPLTGSSLSRCQYTDLDAVRTQRLPLRTPESQNSKTTGLQ
jgi:hypothetical protein